MTNIRGKIRHASRQSDLSKWLYENHTWFAKELKEAGVPNWDIITELFDQIGLTDKNGNPYNKDAVRIGVNRFFKKFPVHVAKSTVKDEPIAESVERTETQSIDYIALSKAIKDKRTIK
jgi:hypothetical protein